MKKFNLSPIFGRKLMTCLRTSAIHLRIVYLCVTAMVLFCGLWGQSMLAPMLLVILIVLPILTGAGLFLSSGALELSLSGEHSFSSGQEAELKLVLECRAFRPMGNIRVDVVCENRVLGKEKTQTYLIEPGRGRRQEFSIRLDTGMCGEKLLRIREMVCFDLLGLFSLRKEVDDVFACVVYPYEARMYVSLQRHMEREQPGDIYDGKKSGTDVSEVFGLREYREGDPLQSIHWKLSGKMKQLIVREFGRPLNYHTLVLISPALHYGEQEVSEQIVNAVFDLAASFSHALLNQNIAHFAGFFSGDELCCMPVDSPNGYENMLLRLMSHPIQKNGDNTLFSFLDQEMYRQYTKVVYVTGAVNETAAANLSALAALTVLQATEGESGYLTGSGNYEVVGVSIDHIRSVEHIIPF